MLLNYPPPTTVNLYQDFRSKAEREKATLQRILDYLNNAKLVNDEDLVLVVDGRQTWFQLPSEVILRQYQMVVDEANTRLKQLYGDAVSQSIVFGAEKVCEGDDIACRYMPKSPLSSRVYGPRTGKETQLSPARYLDAKVIMGPAKDMRQLYEAAVKMLKEKKSQSATVQSVMATLFGEQEMARNVQRKKDRYLVTAKWLDWFGGVEADSAFGETEEMIAHLQPQADRRYEFSIGLDYTHTLFQPFAFCADDELVPLTHDNSTDMSKYHHPGTPTLPLTLPTALQQAKPPFWTPDLSRHNPSPNKRPAYIDSLEFNEALDWLKPRDTSWAQIPLIQNTYTGAIPAVFHVNAGDELLNLVLRDPRYPRPHAYEPPSASITWKSLWYSSYERALLRNFFRRPQSPLGYHTAAVGGDRLWDQRGGRGGVWTQEEALWMPWGEVDGVCGSLKQITEVFMDGKGVWLHEMDPEGRKERELEEEELRKKIEENKQKEAEKEKERLEQEELERARAEGRVQRIEEKGKKVRKERDRVEMAEGHKKEAQDIDAKYEEWRKRRR